MYDEISVFLTKGIGIPFLFIIRIPGNAGR